MKKKQLSNERIDELMTVYDVEVAATLANELSHDFGFLRMTILNPDFISVNHILYFEFILYPFLRFPEFQGIFDHLYYGIEEDILIAPEAVDFKKYALDTSIKLEDIPETIRVQLRPLTREDVLKIAKKIDLAIIHLSIKFSNNVDSWIEDDGLEWSDFEEKYGVNSFEDTLSGAFDRYFDDYAYLFGQIRPEGDAHEYLMRCWENTIPDKYKILEQDYVKSEEERRAMLSLTHYDYLRNHVFNCLEA